MMGSARGAALLLAVMAVALLAALSLSLAVVTSTEMRVSGNYGHAQQELASAEAGLELAVQELFSLVDWRAVASGATRSTFVDGPPSGLRVLSDGVSLDLTAVTTGLGGSAWRLFAHGLLADRDSLPSDAYLMVWVMPDPATTDVLTVRADAFGPSGTRRGALASITRSHVIFWKEIR